MVGVVGQGRGSWMLRGVLAIAMAVAAVAAVVAPSLAATRAPRLLRADVSGALATRPATMSLGCCGQFLISGPRVSAAHFKAGKLGRIRWTDWGPTRADGTGLLWTTSGIPSCGPATFRAHRVTIEADTVRNGRYTRLLLVYRIGRRRVFDRRTLRHVRGMKPSVAEWFGLATHGGPPPNVSTGTAGEITAATASITGGLNPSGRSTTSYFQYGTSSSYGAATPAQVARPGRAAVTVTATLAGLRSGVTYHYRLYAGNAAGVSCSPDRTFTTVLTPQQAAANRAIATYTAIQHDFYAPAVYAGDHSSLYAENYPQSGLRYAYLWPFSRVLAGTITLAGIPSALLGGVSYQSDVADRLTGLSRYWDTSTSPSGYDSYPPAPYGNAGDRYYDDQAWVGLAAAQNYAMTGDPTSLAVAKNVFNYVYPGGWSENTGGFDPGGIFWVNQGIGVGVGNHDRTTTSNAPNAEIALLMENFDPANAALYDAAANFIYGWVNHYLYNVSTNPTDPNAPNPNYAPGRPALMFDKVTGGNAIDPTLYTYNQGAMVAASVREYQRTSNPAYLSQAEAIAQTALSTFDENYYINHSAAFNAIYFRGLLVLYSVTSNSTLQAEILQALQTYADDAWNNHRSSNGLFRFTSTAGNGYQLLDQGAMLQIFAMLAWDPSQYAKLP